MAREFVAGGPAARLISAERDGCIFRTPLTTTYDIETNMWQKFFSIGIRPQILLLFLVGITAVAWLMEPLGKFIGALRH